MNTERWKQIEDLYHAALEQPLGERARFLSTVCGDDAELSREVESLLASADTDDSFMAAPEFDLGLEILAKPQQVLRTGQEFGHYMINAFLGRGGMGEVYLAEDTRLGRSVALKVLPADVASDQERIRRFIQEARAASALNHPNILTIHEVGDTDGWRFIASEFVEGKTLRERLKGDDPPALPEIVGIARQIATALSAAHKVGIIHRDIKPENIMLREDGLVKVLDFGLAKLVDNFDDQKSALVSTQPGMVMGTISYMSPEQTRGKWTDARSDIWSLGVVLYEMVVGRLPFQGDTSSDMIAAILTSEPAFPVGGPADVPHGLWQVIKKALQKDPNERYRSATEMTDGLRNLSTDTETRLTGEAYKATDFKLDGRTDPIFISTAETFRRSQLENIQSGWSGTSIAMAAAALLVMVLGGGYGGFSLLKKSSFFAREPMKITRVFDTGKTKTAAISPDGKYVAHVLGDMGQESLWIKHIATNSAVQLVPPGKAALASITFSKDGSYVYYVQAGPASTLYQIPVLGGDSKRIIDNVHSPISFSPDGAEFAFVRWISADETVLIIADTAGQGERRLLTRKEPEGFGDWGVAWSPDGKILAGSVSTGDKLMNIALMPVPGGEITMLSAQRWRAIEQTAWLPDGSGLLALATGDEGESLTQVWFLPLSGEKARLITTDLNQYNGISLTENADRLLTIQWQNHGNLWRLPNGKSEDAKIVSNNIYAQYRYIALTPDGRIVFPSNENANGNRDIRLMNADGTDSKQLTSNAGGNVHPCGTSDGRYILFASNRPDGKTYHIWRMKMDGSEPVQLTNGDADGEKMPRCPPDPRSVYYLSGGPNVDVEKSRLWKTSIDGGDAVKLTDYSTGAPDISPDGRFIALRFKFEQADPYKLGIVPITGGKPIQVFDVNFGFNLIVRWRPDGQAITFIKTEKGVGNIWEQPINGDPAKALTKFTAELINGFDLSRDGDLFCSRGYETRDPVVISNFK